MLNKVMLIGRLGADPQLRYGGGNSAGSAICRLSVATDESYTDRDGNRVERTEWHNVVVFQRTAENCANFLAKGSLVYVEGSLQTRKWEDKEGQTRYTTEIRAQRVLFLDRKGDGQRSGNNWNDGSQASYQGRRDNRGGDYQGNARGMNGDNRQNRPDRSNVSGNQYDGQAGEDNFTDEIPQMPSSSRQNNADRNQSRVQYGSDNGAGEEFSASGSEYMDKMPQDEVPF